MAAAIVAHPGEVVSHIDGVAASAATYLALAANQVRMSEGGLFMIHNSWTVAFGDKTELRSTADLLDKIDGTILADYVRRTGASADQVRAWMDAETWFTRREALDAKFIDAIDPNTKRDAAAAAARWNLRLRPRAQARCRRAARAGRRRPHRPGCRAAPGQPQPPEGCSPPSTPRVDSQAAPRRLCRSLNAITKGPSWHASTAGAPRLPEPIRQRHPRRQGRPSLVQGRPGQVRRLHGRSRARQEPDRGAPARHRGRPRRQLHRRRRLPRPRRRRQEAHPGAGRPRHLPAQGPAR